MVAYIVCVLSLVIRSLCNVTKQQKAILLKTEQKYIHQLKPVNVGFTKKQQHPFVVQSCMTFFLGNVHAALFCGQEHLIMHCIPSLLKPY